MRYCKDNSLYVSISEKSLLTIDEAASYSGIGKQKIKEISDDEDCPFVLWNGTKRMIKRKRFDEYIDGMFSI